MRELIKIVFLMLGFLMNAQNQVLPIYNWSDQQAGAYYKDLNNELDPFEGTWLYTNGTTTLKLQLEKIEQFYNGTYYEDLIIGEYQYVENGLEVINTLANINLTDAYTHEIYGNTIYKDCAYLPASSCIDGEVRLDVILADPLTEHTATAIVHKRIVNGQDAILVYIIFDQLIGYDGLSQPEPETNMPWQQEYILIKQ